MKLRYPFEFDKVEGLFLLRKNRFTVSVVIQNQVYDAYLPNPGRLWELLIPRRTELILVKNSQKEVTPYTVIACKSKGGNVLLHTHLTNKVVADLINSQMIPFLKGYSVIREEVKVKDSRFDLLLGNHGKNLYLEVKTCTLFGDRVAMFPDAVTERGRRHLLELRELTERGYATSVLFVVMNPKVDYFLPAYHIDYEFAKAFIEVKDRVNLGAISVEWDRDFVEVSNVKELDIPYEFLISEMSDRGVYLLVLELDESFKISIGGLGERTFTAGFYVYVGSAKRGLTERIKRHLRKGKRKRWHIDFLAEKAKSIRDIPIRTGRPIECELAERIGNISESEITGFGCSDCRCKSHLFFFSENPIVNERFIEVVSFYRLNSLKIDP